MRLGNDKSEIKFYKKIEEKKFTPLLSHTLFYCMKSNIIRHIGFLCSDYIIHHKNAHKVIDERMSETLYWLTSSQFPLWIVKNENSGLFVRQFAASMCHFSRFVTTFAFSSTDKVLSSIIHSFVPYNQHFTSLASNQRFYKRMMLTLRVNGGPYEELYNVILSATRSSIPIIAFPNNKAVPIFQKIANEYPVKKMLAYNESPLLSLFRNNEEKMSISDLEKLFARQTGSDLHDAFKSVSKIPYKNNDFWVFDGVTKNGDAVSISVLPKKVERMWNLDKVPFFFTRQLLRIVPFISTEKALFDAVYSRLTIGLKEEVKARKTILEKFDVDLTADPTLVFSQSRRIPLPIRVPAPILSLCSKNILVTERLPRPLKNGISPSIALSVADGFAELLFKHELCIPNISSRNVLYSKRIGVALSRYAPLTHVSNDFLHSSIKLIESIMCQNHNKALNYAKALGIAKRPVEKSLQLGLIDSNVFRDICRIYPREIVGVGEGFVNLFSFKREVGRNNVFMPTVIGIAAKRASPTLNQSNFPYNLFSLTKYIPF